MTDKDLSWGRCCIYERFRYWRSDCPLKNKKGIQSKLEIQYRQTSENLHNTLLYSLLLPDKMKIIFCSRTDLQILSGYRVFCFYLKFLSTLPHYAKRIVMVSSITLLSSQAPNFYQFQLVH